jgi:hypothetical protein
MNKQVELEDLWPSINPIEDAAALAWTCDNAFVKLQIHMLGALI